VDSLASPDAIDIPNSLVEAATTEFDSPRERTELESFHALNYCSFVTLSSLGYGDILPITSIARMLAWVEAIFGQLYLAVMIGNIVGRQVAHQTGQVAEPSKRSEWMD
jgi:hypothetical protein